MIFKDFKKMIEAAEKFGKIKPDDTVCITINNGTGWKTEPITSVVAPVLKVKEYDRIENQKPGCYPQICFAREKR